MGVFIKNVANVSITNNVFFKARRFLVYVEEVLSQYNFEDNVMVGAEKRSELGDLSQFGMTDDVACYEQFIPIKFE